MSTFQKTPRFEVDKGGEVKYAPIVKELSKNERRKISERVKANKDVRRYTPENRSCEISDRRARSRERSEKIK